MSDVLGTDADGLPLFPPMPAGREVPRTGVRSVMRLVMSLDTAVVTVWTADVMAMVVLLGHEPVDGLAVRGGHRVVGPEALDEIADVPVEHVVAAEVSPELARAVGSYFLPTELRGVPAGFVAPEDFVRSLARPGQRGCLLVRTPDALGLVFLAGGGVVLAYQEGGPVGGFEQVVPLFSVPGATLWARLGPDTSDAAPPQVSVPPPPPARPAPPPAVQTPPPVRPAPPPREAPPPLPRPEPPVVVPEPPVPPPVTPQSAPPPPPPPHLAEPVPIVVPPPPSPFGAREAAHAAESPLDVALAEARGVLGPHVVRVEGVFRRAEPTMQGVRSAAESLRTRRIRLLSRATLDLVADRVLAALDRMAASAHRP